MKNPEYKIGDVLVSVKVFPLDDVHHHTYYYGIGDEFILMEIKIFKECVKFNLNSNDSIFEWCINYDELDEFQEYLVHQKDFKRKLRQKKLKEIDR